MDIVRSGKGFPCNATQTARSVEKKPKNQGGLLDRHLEPGAGVVPLLPNRVDGEV
jgi:hypothetical protein